MNSMELFQSACQSWLTVHDQTAMDISNIQGVCRMLNAAQSNIWRRLPSHYKRQQVSLAFYGPETGTVTVGGYGSRKVSGVVFPGIMNVLTYQGQPLIYNGEPLIFNGASVYENPRPYCSIQIDGDSNVNVFDGNALLHPYLGQLTGSVPAILYNNSIMTDNLIERFTTPLIDRHTGREYVKSNFHEDTGQRYYRCWDRTFSMRRVSFEGVSRTLVSLPPFHDQVTVLSAEAFVIPAFFTYGNSQRPIDLIYDDEVAGLIISAAGAELANHPLFDRERFSVSDANQSTLMAVESVSRFSPTTSSQSNLVGTPRGW